MHIGRIFTLLVTGSLISACSAASNSSNDPYRVEYLAACESRPNMKSKDVDKVKKYCRCIYDKTMKGLSDEEIMTARFYLMGQSGIDVEAREDFTSRDITIVANTMMPASNAIGDAVKACGRP